MNTTDNYRYPGSRPFQDTDYDRRLFFGRDEEKQALLHLVLAENLVVLFAKSGMGKTSLLNAGLLQPLRERGFIPLKARFNDPTIDSIQVVYAGIEETVKQHKVEYKSGGKDILWQYFKTAEFWSAEDTLLTPVLILDQFEEFFNLHLPEERNSFITQVADLVKGRIPQILREDVQSEKEFSYTETPPNVKIIISIREDYLGLLEEMSREIPDIFQNRFRLLPLNREQARQAIIEPAQMEDVRINVKGFRYAPQALEAMLDFLCKRRKRRDVIISKSEKKSLFKRCFVYVSKVIGKILDYFYTRSKKYDMKVTDEVEPFQLQLLCQHIEHTVSEKSTKEGDDIIVQKDDLGGETGMQRVLQDFYDNQIKRLASLWKVRKVRKLCEKGLISGTDRRLSVEEEEIERRFKVSKPLLAELVDNRLLRAEPRVGSVYYELSHDTLVEPIRTSQNKRKIKRVKIGGVLAVGVVLLFAIYMYGWQRSYVYTVMGKTSRYSFIRPEAAVELYQKAIQFDPENLLAYYELGNVFERQGKYEEAIKNFKKVVDLDPEAKRSNAYDRLARILREQGRYEEAIEQFQKAIQLNPNSAYSYSELGETLRRQGKYEEAIEQFQKAIQLDPNNDYFYNSLGYMFYDQEKYDEAIKQFREAIQFAPKNANTYDWLGAALYNQNKYDEAIEQFNKAIEIDPEYADPYYWLGRAFYNQDKYDDAIENYQKAIELDPEHTSAYDGLEIVFTKQGKYDEIIEFYKKAIQISPKDAYLYSRLGHVFYDQKKYEEAIEYHHKAINLDPNNALFYRALGHVFHAQEKYDEAIEQYHKAIDLDPDDAVYYVNLGDTLRNQKKYEEAIEQYHKAIELNPDDATLFYVILGNILGDQRKYDEAIEQYHKAIELEPSKAYPYAALGGSLREQGKYEEAIAQYRKAIELEPESQWIYNRLGDTLSDQDKYDEAMEQYHKAIELEPSKAYPYTALGDNLRKQGKYDEAIAQYRKAIELEPEGQWIYNRLGDAFSDQDKFDEAIESYQKALALDPKKFRAKYNLAKTHLIMGRFDAALALAGEVIEEQDIPIQSILGMRFISISALFFQGKKAEAFDELKEFVAYYKSLPENYEKDWKYERSKSFISTTEKLSESDKTLLLTLIAILESPKPEADKKLAELEASLAEMSTE